MAAKAHLLRIVTSTVALALVGGLIWSVYLLLASFFSYVSAVPKEFGAALVAGAATVLVATLTVTLGRYFERKKELDALYRDKKMEIYDEFLRKFFDMMFSTAENSPTQEPADLVAFLREFARKLIL